MPSSPDSPRSPGLPWERLDDRSPLATRMAASAARAIVEQRHEAGALITEADIAATHGASRTPAREAMLQLESWGLVRLIPKKGAVVAPVRTRERRDLLAVRTLFETDAVEAVARGDADLAALTTDLERQLDRQRRAVADADPLAFAGADCAFHGCIVRAGGNDVVVALLETLGPRLARLTYDVALESPGRLPTLLHEHEQLADTARAGDAAGFAALVRRHVAAGHFSPAESPASDPASDGRRGERPAAGRA